MDEALLLRAALLAYALAGLAGLAALAGPVLPGPAIRAGAGTGGLATGPPPPTRITRITRVTRFARLAGTMAASALVLHTLALTQRWAEHGHGPFTTLHEILSSSLWSLSLVLLAAAALRRELRPALIGAAPVLLLLASWALLAPPARGHLPPTYATSLLYLHAVAGKLFLALLLLACGVASVPLLRTGRHGRRWLAGACGDARCAEWAHRCAAAAFVADSLMLVIGAAWAQDAWGRYWAWDPLETWAFLTWLALVMVLHGHATWRLAPRRLALWLWVVFALAFLTFFGVPFLSSAPHQGAL